MSLPGNNEVKMSFRQIIGHVLAYFMLQSIYHVAALMHWITMEDRRGEGMLEGERFGKFRKAQIHGDNVQTRSYMQITTINPYIISVSM